jgi:hypothetical protein
MTPEAYETEIAELNAKLSVMRGRVKELIAGRKFDYVLKGVKYGRVVYWTQTRVKSGETPGWTAANIPEADAYRMATYSSARDYAEYLEGLGRGTLEVIQIERKLC